MGVLGDSNRFLQQRGQARVVGALRFICHKSRSRSGGGVAGMAVNAGAPLRDNL